MPIDEKRLRAFITEGNEKTMPSEHQELLYQKLRQEERSVPNFQNKFEILEKLGMPISIIDPDSPTATQHLGPIPKPGVYAVSNGMTGSYFPLKVNIKTFGLANASLVDGALEGIERTMLTTDIGANNHNLKLLDYNHFGRKHEADDIKKNYQDLKRSIEQVNDIRQALGKPDLNLREAFDSTQSRSDPQTATHVIETLNQMRKAEGAAPFLDKPLSSSVPLPKLQF